MFNKFLPDFRFKKVYDIDAAFLIDNNINLLILDIDNTLVRHGAAIDDKVVEFKQRLEEAGMHLCLMSNNNRRRVEGFSGGHFELALYRSKKPLPFGFKKVMRHFGASPQNTAIAGDQLFTDILGGNLLSLTTILVEPLHSSEGRFIKFKRWLERRIIEKWILKKG